MSARGSSFGLQCFRFLLRLGGVGATALLLWPVTLWYVLFDRKARASVTPYLRHRFPESMFLFWKMWRLFREQGRVLVLREAVLREPARHPIRVLRDDAGLGGGVRGGVVVLSHFGAWQAALPFLSGLQNRFHLIMLPDAAPFLNVAGKANCANISIISPDDFVERLPELVADVEAGAFLMTMGDRLYGAGRLAKAEFLGETATFPASPFRIAKSLELPLFVLFAKENKRSGIDIEVRAISAEVQSYAAELQKEVDASPYQCFLFSDCWQKK